MLIGLEYITDESGDQIAVQFTKDRDRPIRVNQDQFHHLIWPMMSDYERDRFLANGQVTVFR